MKRWDIEVRRAALLELREGRNSAIERLSAVMNELPEHDRWRCRLLLGYLHASALEWKEAARYYEQVTTPAAPTQLVFECAACLSNADKVGSAIRLAERFRKNRGLEPRIAWVEASARSSLGQLDAAEAVLEELLAVEPSDSSARVESASVRYRKSDRLRALARVPSPGSLSKASHSSVSIASKIRARLGDSLGSLETAYAAAVANPTEASYQSDYVTAFRFVERDLGDKLVAAAIASGTTVGLRSSSGDRVFAIRQSQGDVFAGWQIPLSGPMAQRLLGRSAGDSVELEGLGLCEIQWVKNSYVHLYQDILSNFNTRFPSDTALRKVEGTPDELRAHIAATLPDAKQGHGVIVTHFSRGELPIGLLCARFGQSVSSTWGAVLLGEFGKRIPIEGLEAFEDSDEKIRAASALVLDLSSAISLDLMECLDAFLGAGPRLLVAQSTLDDIMEESATRRYFSKQEGATLVKYGDHVAAIPFNKEAAKRNSDWLATLEAKLRAHAEVMGAPTSHADGINEIGDVTGRPSVDSILLAQEQQGFLISEERIVRTFARDTYEVVGASSMGVVHWLASTGRIKATDALRAFVRAILWGYDGVPVGYGTVLMAVNMDEYMVGDATRAVLARFRDPSAIGESVVEVAHDALVRWFESEMPPEVGADLARVFVETLVERSPDGRLALQLEEALRNHAGEAALRAADAVARFNAPEREG